MNLRISNPIAIIIYNYFTNLEERYTRKVFAGLALASTLVIMAIYGLGTDFDRLNELQINTHQEIHNITTTENITPEQALEKLSSDKNVIQQFNDELLDITPSGFWICFIMLLSIPAIIKRTNDTFIARSHSYPVAIYYALYFIQGLTGLTLNLFGLATALSIYSFIFVLFISMLPTTRKEEGIE